MKKTVIVLSLIIMTILSLSLSLAWYHNNREVGIGSDANTIKIQSDGVLQIAYATGEDGALINVASAKFGGSLSMALSRNCYTDVTGNGITGKMYKPELDSTGETQAEAGKWKPANPDSASCSGDSGEYVLMDLYLRSDEIMDIYLLKSSGITPHTEEGNANLVNTVSGGVNYANKSSFSDFENGLPNLNINQSPYGLFSRNLIAGAARASFTEITKGESGDYTEPVIPGIIWVPNTKYHLTRPGATGLLSTMTLNGTEERSYSYYRLSPEGSENAYSKKTVSRDNLSDKLTGELYRVTDDGLECVEITTMSEGMLVPGLIHGNSSNPVPAIYDGTGYIDAAPVTDSHGDTYLVAADYNEDTYSTTNGFAYKTIFGGEPVHVRMYSSGEDKGYVKVTRADAVHPWIDGGEFYVSEADVAEIERGFTKDPCEYRATMWIDEKTAVKSIDNRDCFSDKIATTSSVGNGFYYTRVQVAVWVEGTDNEADLHLNGGEFDINLQFFGVRAE